MTDRFIGPKNALIMNASARIAKLPAIAASNVGKNNSLNLEFNRLYLLSYVIFVTLQGSFFDEITASLIP